MMPEHLQSSGQLNRIAKSIKTIDMISSNAIFKFATIRDVSSKAKAEPEFQIQPQTETSKRLTDILESSKPQAEKLNAFNQALSDLITSDQFFKTREELVTATEAHLPSHPETGGKAVGASESGKLEDFYELLYDNIVIRIASKSNNNELFKLLTDTIKIVHQKINSKSVSGEQLPKLNVLLPKGLIFPFSPPKKEEPATRNSDAGERKALFTKIQSLAQQKEELAQAKRTGLAQAKIEQQKIMKQQAPAVEIQEPARVQKSVKGKAVATKASLPAKEISTAALDKLVANLDALHEKENDINRQLAALNNQAFEWMPYRSYSRIGARWVDVSELPEIPHDPVIGNDSILVYSHGCYLKFPFKIADLRVVEQVAVGYLPEKISYISTTQPGEKQERTTRRFTSIEKSEDLTVEDEVTKETDNQSDEKLTLTKAASDVQSEVTSSNANASVSATYGVVSASVDAGFSNTQSSTNANSASQEYAKQIVQKVVDRVSHKVKSERSTKTLQTFEETISHSVDNTKLDLPKCHVFRWLELMVRAVMKTYGKRLIIGAEAAHPASYYLSRSIRKAQPVLIPPDPTTLRKDSQDPLVKKFYADNPAFPFHFTIDSITEDNYLALATLYRAKLEQPQEKKTIVSYTKGEGDGTHAFGDLIDIPAGYKCVSANFRFTYRGINQSHLNLLLGVDGTIFWSPTGQASVTYPLVLAGETGKLPISIWQGAAGYTINVEVTCALTDSAFKAWQIKCYQAIIDAYEALKTEAESKMSDWNPNTPGLNPAQKTEIIRTELKKAVLNKMFRCNPFWISDNYVVGNEYAADCCKDQSNVERVSFLETVFDWENMTYELYPYFYCDKDNWSDLLNLSDDDPHFEAFLRASYAKINLPVFRDAHKEIAAINFVLNNTIANYTVLPDGIQHILDDLDSITPFGYITDNTANPGFKEIKKEYDKQGKPTIYYLDDEGHRVPVSEVEEFDKEGNTTKFYYDGDGHAVISEIKEGINAEGQKYSYYFNADNEKIICHKTQTEYDLDGNATPFYSTDLGVFRIPTDLVILESGVENGVELSGYPEDPSEPGSDVVIRKEYSPAIIRRN